MTAEPKPRPKLRGLEPSCLFPPEAEIAKLVMGKNAARWKDVAAVEERCGMPKIDPLYGGRYWPAVRAYLDSRHGIGNGPMPVDGAENWGAVR